MVTASLATLRRSMCRSVALGSPPATTFNSVVGRGWCLSQISFDGSPDLVIEMANGARHFFSAEFDKARTDLNIKRVNDERKWVPELFRGQPPDPIVGTFRLNAGAPGYLMLEGVYEEQLIQANLRRGEMKFLLLEHGSHWIHDRLFWAR
jgi:hypothetical protein